MLPLFDRASWGGESASKQGALQTLREVPRVCPVARTVILEMANARSARHPKAFRLIHTLISVPDVPLETRLSLYHEAMRQLRHLSDDVWQGLRFFVAVEAFLLSSILFLMNTGSLRLFWMALAATLGVVGVLAGLAGRYIFKRHRIYYLQALAKKSLLEEELGLYRSTISGSETDRALPWRLTPEVVKEIQQGFETWIEKSIRAPGTIAFYQFLIYEILIGLFGILTIVALRNLVMSF